MTSSTKGILASCPALSPLDLLPVVYTCFELIAKSYMHTPPSASYHVPIETSKHRNKREATDRAFLAFELSEKREPRSGKTYAEHIQSNQQKAPQILSKDGFYTFLHFSPEKEGKFQRRPQNKSIFFYRTRVGASSFSCRYSCISTSLQILILRIVCCYFTYYIQV